ncbi:Methenyltetrahydromethanopterin cyclohydrolase [Planctomycetes bacterium Pan216]|uniref:Methenyltetrahydromethanopterin cyclohydrolase n=1 Tax=Kolteria novifilia TaxID=2527975 RepID=A0A518B1R9_9BACT|nr:Methenyltetrahydromethanopterin cyclohydrolase [Planctomycetes bacterium Pan216]
MTAPRATLNARAHAIAQQLVEDATAAKVNIETIGKATVVDCGVATVGSLKAGHALAEACIGGMGRIAFGMDRLGSRPCGKITVEVDEPVAACLLSQYAGWELSLGDYFAMTSGPMRIRRGKEPLFEKIKYTETTRVAVGVLESSKLPTEEVIKHICDEINILPASLILLVARTASIAGSYQVVARSVETCMHKLFELQFPNRIVAASGTAFLPPIPKDDLTAIGRTNDSILYGGEVVMWVEGDDEPIERLGPLVPSCASSDYGEPFASIFERAGRDFYQIDANLFSPASVLFNNVQTGSSYHFGNIDETLLERSFFEL